MLRGSQGLIADPKATPLIENSEQIQQVDMRPEPERRHTMDRILVLSDDLGQQPMVRQVLESAGYEVVTAISDESAIDIF